MILFQSYEFHMYSSLSYITYHINSIVKKHIDIYVTMVPCFLLIPNTLVSFKPNGYIWTYIPVITYHINSILKHIDAYVTMVPWFSFNPQYTGFISIKMVIIYNSVITHHINSIKSSHMLLSNIITQIWSINHTKSR